MTEAQPQTTALPTTFEEFLRFDPTDGSKYEWNDGELVKSSGMKRRNLRIVQALNLCFDKTTGISIDLKKVFR